MTRDDWARVARIALRMERRLKREPTDNVVSINDAVSARHRARIYVHCGQELPKEQSDAHRYAKG